MVSGDQEMGKARSSRNRGTGESLSLVFISPWLHFPLSMELTVRG